ncbi:MAG: nuclear transport factor 2 family protein [Candidatus Acidiferrum sp.]
MSLARFVGVLLTICVGAAMGAAQNSSVKSKNTPEEQVKQVELDWLSADAKGDAASLQRIIADEFIGTNLNGGLLFKADIIPQNAGPGGFAGATPGQTNVRVFGDTAVLMGIVNTGGTHSDQIRVTLVFQKRQQEWQIIAAHLAR